MKGAAIVALACCAVTILQGYSHWSLYGEDRQLPEFNLL
jgi:hypothetical protein